MDILDKATRLRALDLQILHVVKYKLSDALNHHTLTQVTHLSIGSLGTGYGEQQLGPGSFPAVQYPSIQISRNPRQEHLLDRKFPSKSLPMIYHPFSPESLFVVFIRRPAVVFRRHAFVSCPRPLISLAILLFIFIRSPVLIISVNSPFLLIFSPFYAFVFLRLISFIIFDYTTRAYMPSPAETVHYLVEDDT
jgi:hypothetical protein